MAKAVWAVAWAMAAAAVIAALPNASPAADGLPSASSPAAHAAVSNPPTPGQPLPSAQSSSIQAHSAQSTQSPSSAPATSSALSGAAAPDYRIAAEDVLQISVWDNKELSLSVVVRPDGHISFPLVEDVPAEGLTAADLSAVIRQKLLAYIKEPQVSVIVTQVNGPRVYVIGNVVRPGVIPLRSDLSVLQVLSIAGGFPEFASPRGIRIVRMNGTKQEVRKVNYNRLIEPGGEGNYVLKPGDTIVVP